MKILLACLLCLGACGGSLPDGKCRSTADCSDLESCLKPGQHPGCGACMTPMDTCNDDNDCSGNSICEPVVCACAGEKTCVSDCTIMQNCAAWQECGPDGRCMAAACSAASPCPAQFDCTNSTCSRRTCDGDGDCDGEGFCVGNKCYDDAGTCNPPAA